MYSPDARASAAIPDVGPFRAAHIDIAMYDNRSQARRDTHAGHKECRRSGYHVGGDVGLLTGRRRAQPPLRTPRQLWSRTPWLRTSRLWTPWLSGCLHRRIRGRRAPRRIFAPILRLWLLRAEILLSAAGLLLPRPGVL